jgi:hypothetical protein
MRLFPTALSQRMWPHRGRSRRQAYSIWESKLQMDLGEILSEGGEGSWFERGPVAGFSEHDWTIGLPKNGEYVDGLNVCQLFKELPAPWSLCVCVSVCFTLYLLHGGTTASEVNHRMSLH